MWQPRARLDGQRRTTWSKTDLDAIPRLPGTYAIYRRDPMQSSHPPLAPEVTSPKAASNTAIPAILELGPPKLVYIGSAENIRARLTDFGINGRHQKRITHFGQVDRISVKVAPDRRPLQHLTREARLIRRLRPPLNRVTWSSHK